MAPRTRATASAVLATAPLSAAPRRRLKVTPLDTEAPVKLVKLVESETKQTTRATRSKQSAPASVEKPAAATSKTSTTRTRGRPKKTETIAEHVEPEAPTQEAAEKSKHSVRATRATATTASSIAKEKPAARAPKRTKTATKEQSIAKVEPEQKEEHVVQEVVPALKVAPKKKVTFQDAQDDKENQPITTTNSKKATASNGKPTGLRARPVRKPVIATRASKRSKETTSDDEDEKPSRKIQRVLTPKKITQIARVLTPEEASEDELNGGKTPVRDLNMSPKRPQTAAAVEAVAQRLLSPAKNLDFGQSLLQQTAKQNVDKESDASLMSPARRPPMSSAKLFAQSIIASPPKASSEQVGNALASPARRPMDSPAKLLFPNATNKDRQASLAQSSNNLFQQSPKRSAIFDPTRVFAHSAVKPHKDNVSKSSFFSSPAKRTGLFSPSKQLAAPLSTRTEAMQHVSSDDVDLNEMEATELLNTGAAEISVSSHQRASVSPMRPYKLTADELNMDFDDSILPVRSPLKVNKSPPKSTTPIVPATMPQPVLAAHDNEDDTTELLSSVQSTPRATTHDGSSFINLQSIEADSEARLQGFEQDDELDEPEDDTIVLEDNRTPVTPHSVALSYHDNDISLDELAPSPQDIVAEFVRMPGTPATLHEHELTNIITSPVVETASVQSPASLYENELTTMGSTPRATIATNAPVTDARGSPASLCENELTLIGGTPRAAVTPGPTLAQPKDSPVSLYENEITMMGAEATPKRQSSPSDNAQHESITTSDIPQAATTPRPSAAKPEHSPASLCENELTFMASSSTPRIKEARTPASISEQKLTTIATSFTPEPRTIQTPVSVAEHELTMMIQDSPHDKDIEEKARTPVPTTVLPATSTPNLPIPRKFNVHTTISKIPLKPEGQESPFKFQIKKRKRPHSLGGQPEFLDIVESTSSKSARTASSPDATTSRSTPAPTPASLISRRTPTSRLSIVKNARRVTSTPTPRTPLTPVAGSDVLSGVVVFVDVRTSEGADASAIYIDLLTTLGAKVVKEWKDNITHIVYKDGNSKILEKARLADSSVKVVGVSWPLDCDAQKTWIDETDYLLNLTATDHVINSVKRSAKRKSMEPSMLIADGSGSVRRSKSRRSSVRPLTDSIIDFSTTENEANIATPQANAAKKAADLEKNSLTAAWKSINAPQNLGEDTPARRTLELLQKSYEIENSWDDSLISNEASDNAENDQEDTENTPMPAVRDDNDENEGEDTEIPETGLTPAPYKMKSQTGSAPAKANMMAGLSSYRERVEEMERREMRDNAFGTKDGKRGKGKRMTVFGFEEGK